MVKPGGCSPRIQVSGLEPRGWGTLPALHKYFIGGSQSAPLCWGLVLWGQGSDFGYFSKEHSVPLLLGMDLRQKPRKQLDLSHGSCLLKEDSEKTNALDELKHSLAESLKLLHLL